MTEKPKFDAGADLMSAMFDSKMVEHSTKARFRYPVFQEWTQSILFGEVWQREGLSVRKRSLCVLAALTVLDRPVELRNHIIGALNNGVEAEEILEAILQMAFYGGWPVAVSALKLADEVFEQQGVEVRPRD